MCYLTGMAEQSLIVAELKRALRAKSLTYGAVAEKLDLSVASVKRLFSRGDLSLKRVDLICDLLETSVAELLERVLVVLLPIVGILYPIWSLLPRIYRWQMQRRIFRLYGELRLIERTLLESKDPDERAQMLARFQELERQVLDLKLPQSFSEMSFNLKMHVRALSESAHKRV